MPHIKKEYREQLAFDPTRKIHDNAELNYVLSMVIIDYLDTHGLSYNTIDNIKGAISGAYDEFNDLIVRPYEDTKRKENGCIYKDIIAKNKELGKL